MMVFGLVSKVGEWVVGWLVVHSHTHTHSHLYTHKFIDSHIHSPIVTHSEYTLTQGHPHLKPHTLKETCTHSRTQTHILTQRHPFTHSLTQRDITLPQTDAHAHTLLRYMCLKKCSSVQQHT